MIPRKDRRSLINDYGAFNEEAQSIGYCFQNRLKEFISDNSLEYLRNRMQKVEVYWNLHKNCYSVRCDGKVTWYANSLELHECTFKVSKAGRTRVRTEGRKNVHAFICGFLSSIQTAGLDEFETVTYNPYVNETFVLRGSGEKIEKSKVVKFFTIDGKPKVVAYIGE